MRRKLLVLLLTLTLVLSFMPMIAFADVEAEEQASVNETSEEEKTSDETEAEVSEEATSVDETAADEESADALSQKGEGTEITGEDATEGELQKIDNAQALNASADDEDNESSKCAHENTYTVIEMDWENVISCVPVDDRMHKVTGPGAEVTYCEVCDEEVKREELAKVEKEYEHDYDENHVCIECKYKNQCKHRNTYEDEERDWDKATYKKIDKNDVQHKVSGPVEITTWCEDCGEKIKTETVEKETVEDHNYENHKCTDCGYKNSCKHEHTYTDYRWDDEKVKYKFFDEKYHKVSGPGEKVEYCVACGDEVSVEKVSDVDEKAFHNYENHKCTDCGYKTGCKHVHTYTYYRWDNDDEAVKCTPVDNVHHKLTGPAVLVTNCEDCDDEVSAVKVSKAEEKTYHDYVNGVCAACGHNNTCTHPSKYYEYSYDEDRSYIVDRGDKQHEVTGVIDKYTYCKTCEELISYEELGRTTVTEIHYYGGGDECIYCGHPKKGYIRIFGNTRYDTAKEAAERYKTTSGSKFENIIVAYGGNFPDALSGGYLAKVKKAPILLVEPAEENRIVKYISENIAYGGKVYILGGTGVVSEAFENRIKEKEIATERLGGKTRFDTNLAILKAAGVNVEDILVCTGSDYADSLSVSAVGKPILLVGNNLTDAQKKYIKGLSTKQFYLIGGTGAVKHAIQTDLESLGDYNIQRLWGQTRYETSTAVAKKFFAKAQTVVLAFAQNFPDGLSGGPLAMLENAPIVLTDSKITAAAKEYVKSAEVVRSITLGGPTLISDIAVKAILGK